MQKTLILFAFLVVIQISQAQNYKFGKVSKEELLETENKLDPEANATVLYRKQYIHFEFNEDKGFLLRNEIHERIKIYNKEGFDQATQIIHLYNANSKKVDLIGLKAITYNLEGGKPSGTKLKKDGIFDEETNKYWKSIKFTMPDVKDGSIIEYKYTILSPFINIGEIELQQKIPIKKLELKLESPEYFNYKKIVNPKAVFYPKFKNSIDEKLFDLSYRASADSGSDVTIRSTKVENKQRIRLNVVEVVEDNIPALKNEPMVSNLEIYKAKVQFELNYIKYPGKLVKSFSTTWEKVSKTIYDYDDFGEQLRKKGYYEDDVNAVLNGIEDPQAKTATLFDFVKSKVKWNGLNGYLADEGVRKAYKQGVGNVADINLMLVSMLRYAGLAADPVLVSTKDNGIPFAPTRKGFNYVICNVQFGDSHILLDATSKFGTANILPLKTLNWQGRMIREDGTSSWVNLNPKKPSREIRSLNVKMDSDLSITGIVRNQFTDLQALNYRNQYENYSTEDFIESLEEDKGEIEISNFEVKNLNDLSKPITQSYEYKYDNAIEQIGDKLYFTPLLFLADGENPFKAEKRNYPIDFVYPIADNYIVNVIIPDGYVVETLPQNAKIEFNGKGAEFTYMVRQIGKMLQFNMSFDLKNTLILSSEYTVFKQFYQTMIDKQTEKVVLAKAI